MKLISWLTIIILILFSGTSQALEITLNHDDLQSAFRDLVIAEAPWDKNDLAIDNFTCTPTKVTIPTGTITYTVLNQIHPQYLGSKSLSVIINVDGNPLQKLKMNGVLNLYGDVVVTSHRLRRNTIITEDDLTLARRKITGFAHQLVPSIADAINLEVNHTLGSGTVLLARYIKKQTLISRGDLVTILAQNGTLTITAHGEAKSKGAEGDIIRIKNLGSRRIISAKVLGQGLVEVNF